MGEKACTGDFGTKESGPGPAGNKREANDVFKQVSVPSGGKNNSLVGVSSAPSDISKLVGAVNPPP